jgi:site-specific recombinase XerD
MEITKAVSLYENYLDSEERADNTKRNYLATINRFITYSSFIYVKDITPDSIVTFKNNATKNGAGGISSNTYLSALRSFFTYLYESEHTDKDFSKLKVCGLHNTNKAKSIRGVRQYKDAEEDSGKVIPKKHQALMLEYAAKTAEGKRNRLMIETALVCGFRVIDLVDLKVSHFDFMTGFVKKVLVKTHTLVNFCVGSEGLMNRLREFIIENNLGNNDYIFQTDKKTPLTEAGFSKMFRTVLTKAGLPSGKVNDGYTPHDLRRTCATVLLERGMSIREIQKRLGHSSVTVTERYLKEKDTEEHINSTKKMVSSAFSFKY